jgi:hypothetical protein
MTKSLRIANCSGFYGDRRSAAREMVEGGPIDVLTGDYLAELTMAILHRTRERRPDTGYATTFLSQMEQVLGTCLDRGIRVVANAGGLNPAGLARELERVAGKLGLRPRIAYLTGDDVMDRLEVWQRAGHPLAHLDRGTPLSELKASIMTANAYLGGWGIAEALARGADVVITGRVTDASLVVGPTAWHFGWSGTDWDRLASAVGAGHVLECGAQCCGGNYAFFTEVPTLTRVGFPIAEMHEDGSFVVTKHPGTGGLVSVGTVTAQLLYEIDGPGYLNPDVTARFESVSDMNGVRRGTGWDQGPGDDVICHSPSHAQRAGARRHSKRRMREPKRPARSPGNTGSFSSRRGLRSPAAGRWPKAARSIADGLARARQGVAAIEALGSADFTTYFLSLLADTLVKAGQTDAALDVIEQALAAVERIGERFYAAELYRQRGELLHAAGRDGATACFETALATARQQGASALERRAVACHGAQSHHDRRPRTESPA